MIANATVRLLYLGMIRLFNSDDPGGPGRRGGQPAAHVVAVDVTGAKGKARSTERPNTRP